MSEQASRVGEVTRKTRETEIEVRLNLDGRGESAIETGIGFFDHLLTSFARHGFFDLHLKAHGDLEVDGHHTVEDVGLCLGAAFRKAVDKEPGFARFGHAVIPMDDALVMVAVDISGRPFLSSSLVFTNERVGELDLCLVEEFLRSFSVTAAVNLHVQQWAGDNDHHVVEALFKALGRALSQAVRFDERVSDVLSTKGKLREEW